jgi:HK97 gp10 family phage protein
MGGIKIVFNKLPDMKRATRKEVGKEVRKTTLLVEGGAKTKIMTGPKSGRQYKRGKKFHQASAPGEAPATDTGNLVNSIQSDFEGDLKGMVNVHAEYAEVLEYGSVRMDRRPYLTPATEEQRDDFEKNVAMAVKRGTK